MYSNKYFEWYWENPLKTYNKVKEYFLPIKPKFQWSFGKLQKAKILEINSFDLTWKSKWNEPRHEYNPRIFISLFNYIHLYIEWTLNKDSMDDMVYWEAVLNWIHYGKSLQEACTNGWSYWDDKTQQYERMSFTLLNDPYQIEFDNNKLTNLYYEGNTKD